MKRPFATSVPLIASLSMLSIVAACSTHRAYQGALPEEYVATVKGSRSAVGVRIFFKVVESNGEEKVAYAVEVPNGPQKISVHFAMPDGTVSPAPRLLSFYAEGGRTYRVRGADVDQRVWLWIEDTDTHEIVGGIKP